MKAAQLFLKSAVAIGSLSLFFVALITVANPNPVVAVTNASKSQVVVSFDTDVQEVYPSEPVVSGGAFEAKVTSRDKLLFVVATFPGGKVIRSQGIYTTSGTRLAATITNDAIHVDYVQG